MKAQNAVNGLLVRLWDKYAPIYEQSFGKISVFQGFAKKLGEYLLPVRGGVVLDGGCGPGLHFEMIIRATNPSQLIGLDISPKMLEEANRTRERLNRKHRCQIDLKEADLCKGIPFPDNTFDAQVYHLVLYYLPSGKWREVLREAFRAAKPGGYVISSNSLKRFDFRKEIGIGWLIKETLFHPRVLYLSMAKAKPILVKFQDLEKEGILSYPSERELVDFHQGVGFEKVVCKEIWKNMIMIRAYKPK